MSENNFRIPSTTRRASSFQELGQIDITLYHEDDSETGRFDNKTSSGLGYISCTVQLDNDEENIMVELQELKFNHKPSNFVCGASWIFQPQVEVCIKRNRSKSDSIFAMSTMNIQDWTTLQNNKVLRIGTPTDINYKNKSLKHSHLHFTIFDKNRRHPALAIGHVTIDLGEVKKADIEKHYFKREIGPHSEVSFMSYLQGLVVASSGDTFLDIFYSTFP